MRLRKKIGILGCGNMGRAILAGLIKRRVARSGDVFVHDIAAPKLAEVRRQFKVHIVRTLKDLAGRVEVLVLAIKPQDLKAVARDLRPLLTPRHSVITILAGASIARMKKELGQRTRVLRAMPNLGATVGESVTAITGAARRDLKVAEAIFSGCGQVIQLAERHFDLVTALSGSGPAYFFYLAELLVREGRRHGLSEREASFLVQRTAKGAALLALGSRDSISVLRKRVTSKGGTTEAALATLERGKFPDLIARAIMNAIRRARTLGRACLPARQG